MLCTPTVPRPFSSRGEDGFATGCFEVKRLEVEGGFILLYRKLDIVVVENPKGGRPRSTQCPVFIERKKNYP
jgi:hypothetical protein